MSNILDILGITPSQDKKQIVQILRQRYSVDDLDESVFAKRIGFSETFCLEFDGLSTLIKIRKIRDCNDVHTDDVLYDSECQDIEDSDEFLDDDDDDDDAENQ